MKGALDMIRPGFDSDNCHKKSLLGCGNKAARLSIERRQPIFWKLDWAIVGGESGPRAMREERVSDIQCASRKADTAWLLQQWGGKLTGRVYRGRTCDEMPAARRVDVTQGRRTGVSSASELATGVFRTSIT